MEPKDQLTRLARIQELALGIRAAQATIDGAPGRIEEIEGRFRERNAEYVAVKDRHDELDADTKTRNAELTELDASRKKFMEDLMQVTNQREYAAMLKEIDQVKSSINEHEDAILKNMEELEQLKGEIEKHAAHIEEERKLVERERAEVEASVAASHETIETFGAERAGIEAELPAALVASVTRLEEQRQGYFMSRAEDGTCQSCYVRIRPQAFQEVRLGTAIHYCSNCKRMLYHGPVQPPAADNAAPAAPADTGAATDASSA